MKLLLITLLSFIVTVAKSQIGGHWAYRMPLIVVNKDTVQYWQLNSPTDETGQAPTVNEIIYNTDSARNVLLSVAKNIHAVHKHHIHRKPIHQIISNGPLRFDGSSANISIGFGTLSSNTSGSNNTAIGTLGGDLSNHKKNK